MKRRQLPSLNSLRSFEAVARHLSFTRAADELCVTQSAVSHQMKALEQYMNARLLVRGAAGLELTLSGKRLREATEVAFDDLAAATTEIRRQAERRCASLHVQVSTLFSQFWLAPRITSFAAAHANVEVCLYHGQKQAPTTADLVAIVAAGPDAGSPSREPLLMSDLVPLCSPSLIVGLSEKRRQAILRGTPLLCEADHDWWSDWKVLGHDDQGFNGNRIYFDDPATLLHIAIAGHGIAMGAPALLRDRIASGQLTTLVEPSRRISRAYYLERRQREATSRHASLFQAWLVSEARAAQLQV
jgi:LysR family glycine cleavage system transcriptional activator